MWVEPLLERGWIPDPLVRVGIRRMLRQRLHQESRGDEAGRNRAREALLSELGTGPIARHTGDANDQHYEVPTAFYEAVLGPHLKYSCGLWEEDVTDLAGAERRMLARYVERAQIRDGQRILDLGCGWGSFALYVAERFPAAEVLAVSNSTSQVQLVRERAAHRGLPNVQALRCDVNELRPEGTFDRVVSVEMFEHMGNFRLLLRRIASWLRADGRLFVHHFAHRRLLYRYQDDNDGEWMARHFFTGGIMPCADLLARYDDDLRVVDGWEVNGRHYQRTCEAWLENMTANRARVMAALRDAYGATEAERRWHMWRTFFLACAELFGHRAGDEWLVVHRLLAPAGDRRAPTAVARDDVEARRSAHER